MDKMDVRRVLFRYAHYAQGKHCIRPADTDAFCETVAKEAEEDKLAALHMEKEEWNQVEEAYLERIERILDQVEKLEVQVTDLETKLRRQIFEGSDG